MEWYWHKMRKAWFAVSARVKFRRNGSGSSSGDACCSASGLLKLQDDVQMCGYKDVEVMWNMLYKSQQEQMEAEAVVIDPTPKTKNKQRHNWRAFFWSHHSTATPNSFTCQVLITQADEKYSRN